MLIFVDACLCCAQAEDSMFLIALSHLIPKILHSRTPMNGSDNSTIIQDPPR